MEKATSKLRRSGALLLSLGTGYQELNMIISDIKTLKSQVKAIKDTQRTIIEDLCKWTSYEQNKSLQELFLCISQLSILWHDAQNTFAASVSEYKHNFEMILEGEKATDALRNKFANCEVQEEKAKKKVAKAEKKQNAEGKRAAEEKLAECVREKEVAYSEAIEKAKENEVVKLMRMKSGLLKMSEAYLTLASKCMCIFEAQKEIIKKLPDVGDEDIHEVRFDDMVGAREILERTERMVRRYKSANQPNTPASPTDQMTEPPPPYTPTPGWRVGTNTPFNPYYETRKPNAYRQKNFLKAERSNNMTGRNLKSMHNAVKHPSQTIRALLLPLTQYVASLPVFNVVVEIFKRHSDPNEPYCKRTLRGLKPITLMANP